ncbi:MAG TPA: hypothetical protein PK175_00570 [Syntrophales bacterium]|jgi:hypothetical protein|nr:hypothetical protein [Syntrophales bacterium]HON24026.1 hypothetical protein [Syntrophales bacterium]HOU76688.1 hypothetical protein [Syntrophales bacterium]HPC31445.1 hypothetical protein [Syntrophales bacterium]HQG33351.1 hypothetical protein [Syntrophales bacterium]
METTTDRKPEKLRINQNNLYREEIFTDMQVGALHQLTPVKPNGELDKQRKIVFIGNTQLITKQGPLPIRFPIDAKNLQQAAENFPEAMESFVAKMIEEAKELQRREESRIILPGASAAGNIIPG